MLRFATLLGKSNIGGVTMAQAYCMKCRKKVEIKNPRSVTLKNKRPATQGVCPTCGTKVFRIGKG
jgi:DNA-directed RNA polymerase subunit RPC12/RpoP